MTKETTSNIDFSKQYQSKLDKYSAQQNILEKHRVNAASKLNILSRQLEQIDPAIEILSQTRDELNRQKNELEVNLNQINTGLSILDKQKYYLKLVLTYTNTIQSQMVEFETSGLDLVHGLKNVSIKVIETPWLQEYLPSFTRDYQFNEFRDDAQYIHLTDGKKSMTLIMGTNGEHGFLYHPDPAIMADLCGQKSLHIQPDMKLDD
jgi:hypothetical protein